MILGLSNMYAKWLCSLEKKVRGSQGYLTIPPKVTQLLKIIQDWVGRLHLGFSSSEPLLRRDVAVG